jgi:hypothetical protein
VSDRRPCAASTAARPCAGSGRAACWACAALLRLRGGDLLAQGFAGRARSAPAGLRWRGRLRPDRARAGRCARPRQPGRWRSMPLHSACTADRPWRAASWAASASASPVRGRGGAVRGRRGGCRPPARRPARPLRRARQSHPTGASARRA